MGRKGGCVVGLVIISSPHTQEMLEGQKRELEGVVEDLKHAKGELEAEIIPLQAELEADATRMSALEASKDEVQEILFVNKLHVFRITCAL